jgi:hypothetical protein
MVYYIHMFSCVIIKIITQWRITITLTCYITSLTLKKKAIQWLSDSE